MAEIRKRNVAGYGVADFNIFGPILPFMDVRVFLANGTIAAGQCVKLDAATIATTIGSATAVDTLAKSVSLVTDLKKVIVTGTTAGGEACIGVALEAAVSGGDVRVIVGGFCPKVLISTVDVTAGQGLVAAAVAGACETYAAGTHTAQIPFGYALSTETDNAGYVAAWILPRVV